MLPTYVGIERSHTRLPVRAAASFLAVAASRAAFYVVSDRLTLDAWSHVLPNRAVFLAVGSVAWAGFTATTVLQLEFFTGSSSFVGLAIVAVASAHMSRARQQRPSQLLQGIDGAGDH